MPILAAATPVSTVWLWVAFVFALGVSVAVAAAQATGARHRPLSGRPDRLSPHRAAWPFLLVLFAGVIAWLAPQMVYGSFKQGQLASTTTQPFDLSMLSPRDWALLATVPPLLGFAALQVGDAAFQIVDPGLTLGLSPRNIRRGLATGALGIVMILPPLIGVDLLTEKVYEWIHYSHPPEHDLLRVMGQAHDLFDRSLLLLGAAVAAPLFEELLFRGHIQTIIRHTLLTISRASAAPASNAELIPPAGGDSALPPALPATVESPSPAWPSWAAIIVTSLIFSLVHPAWSRPPIFVLAVCLGYGYEVTGNLWVPITIHALFNLTMSVLYLLSSH